MPDNYLFTVFTPTYNRAYKLPDVYDCLCRQTAQIFEWLVVDDGSTDNTAELVRNWQAEGKIPIRYIHQENQGKHVAFNRGVSEARGELFLNLDSDDTCVPDALERFSAHWQQIPASERDRYSGVSCLCQDGAGRIVGSPYPRDVFDSDPLTLTARYRVTGEKWGFQRTDVLREYPFPVFPGERFVPESTVWNRIGQKYRMRFVNEALRVYVGLKDGLSASNVALRARNTEGARNHYLELLSYDVPLLFRLKALINYLRFSLHAEAERAEIINVLRRPVLGGLFFPLGYLFYRIDRGKFRKSSRRQ